MKNIFIVVFTLIIFSKSFAQSTFEFLYSTSNNDMAISLAEDGEGNIFIPIINFQNALIIKLDQEGLLMDTLSISNPFGTCRLESLIRIDDEHIGALGNWYTDSTAQFWYILMNNNLEILVDEKIYSNNWQISDFQAIINHKGNIVFMAGYYYPGATGDDICLYEITTDGVLKRNHFFDSPSIFNIPCALLENKDNSFYKVITTGRLDTMSTRMTCFINLVDTNFNLVEYKHINSWDIQPRTSAQWLNDSIYLMAGKWLPVGTTDWDLGILKLTAEDSIIATASFGKPDTVDWSANYKCMDFISNENIFFVGTNNTYNPYFQESPSWIMVNILDSDFNLKNQQFYKGDAYYNSMSVLATQDSGCVISCTRYDYLNRPDDYDTYILKVNKDGLLVSIPENQIGSTQICNIYPNPGRDIINIESYLDNCQFALFNLTGNSVLSSRLNIGVNTMYVANLPNGIYLYRILDENDNLVQTGKWIKYE